MIDLVFLNALRDKLKGGNISSIHLNALPGRYASRLDFSNFDYIAPGTAERFLHTLLTKASFEFNVSFDSINFNTISSEDQKRLSLLSKRLNSLYIENEDNFKEHGLKTFGFGYPLIIKRSRKDLNKLIKAPLFIWPLEIIKSYNKVNSWSILRNKARNDQGKITDEEIHSVGPNEVLISYIKSDDDISVAPINEELLEDAVIDKDELITTCVAVLQSLNAGEQNLFEQLSKKFNEDISKIPDATHFESISGNLPWIHFGGTFGLFRSQKESIITDIDRLIERFHEFQFENLVPDEFLGTPFSAVKTDPSQQELLSTLTSAPKKIIQGPPGTGKSQSLTALITNALANKLRCLVVCEKKTALDVIKQNLNREHAQLGALSAVVEDINKDRDGIVNSVRERINNVGARAYFNHMSYEQTRSNTENLAESINKQHTTLANQIYQGKNWTELVGEYLCYERQLVQNIFKTRLDHKDFLFVQDENELNEIVYALKTAEKLFKPVRKIDHPLSVLHEKAFDFPNPSETKINIEYHLAELIKRIDKILLEINQQKHFVKEWQTIHYTNYNKVVRDALQRHMPFLEGETLAEKMPLPIQFELEKYGTEIVLIVAELESAVSTELENYKAWLTTHYNEYYQSIVSKTDDYLKFVEDNNLKFGNKFLQNGSFARFKTNLLSVFFSKYKTLKENRAALTEKIGPIQDTSSEYAYIEHEFNLTENERDLNMYVDNIKALRKKADVWHAATNDEINRFWETASSRNLHDQYNASKNAFETLERSSKELNAIAKEFFLIDSGVSQTENLHVILQDASLIKDHIRGVINNFSSFKSDYAKMHESRQLLTNLLNDCEALLTQQSLLNEALLNQDSYEGAHISLKKIEATCQLITTHLDDFRNYYYWRIFFQEQTPKVKKAIIAAVEAETTEWHSHFQLWYSNWLLSIHENRSLPTSQETLEEFKEAKAQFKKLQIGSIISFWESKQMEEIRKLNARGISPVSLFNKRGTRGEKRNSLRKIVLQSFDLFTSFFPVIMVSPSVCSSILPLAEGQFDVVIFDEASQLRLEDTFPALVRGQLKIVSGDSQQMPPSSYFQGGSSILNPGEENEEEGEEEQVSQRRKVNNSLELAESESLLVYAENCSYKQSYLKVHYRSQHPFLIDFSNHAFYGKRLIPMPAIADYKPIHFIEVDGMYEESVNRDEARQVVDILLNHIKPLPGGNYPSVGVATFNLYQRNLILEEITKARQNPESDKKINDLGSDFFVKNLENIQGDERDIIIISTTFGRRLDGSFRQMFGPIVQRNGYKLLNVIITRAKYKLFVCTSVPQDYIQQYPSLLRQFKNTGRAALYTYLAYAKAVSEGNGETRERILDLLYENCDSKSFDIENDATGSESPFEDEVYYRLAAKIGEDRLQQQYQIGGFRIDLIVKSEKTGEPIIAIECDGAKYHSSNEAYAWDLFRQEQIEQYGLVFYRIWSTNWWYSPEKELRNLIELINDQELKNNLNNKNGVPEFLQNIEIVPITKQQQDKTRVGLKSIVTVKDPDGKIFKLKFTKNQDQNSINPAADSTIEIYERSPLAISLMTRAVEDICQLGSLEVYYEIINVE